MIQLHNLHNLHYLRITQFTQFALFTLFPHIFPSQNISPPLHDYRQRNVTSDVKML